MNSIDNGNRLTKASISRYLSWALDASTNVQSILPLASETHQNIRVKVFLNSNEHNFVIRRMPCSENFSLAPKISPYNLEVEFTALKELEKVALPTLKVCGLDMTGKFFGTPAFIMEYIEGPTLLEVVESNPEEVINRFAATILEMNQITTAQVPNVVVYSGMPGNAPADSLGWLENQTKQIDVPDFFHEWI